MSEKCCKCEDANLDEKNVLQYPCQRKFCLDCVANDIRAKLEYFEYRLNKDLNSFQNTSSYLSCLKNCKACRLSVSFDRILQSLDNLKWGDLDKEIFRSLSDLGKTFFSGLNTLFYKCINCTKVSSALQCYPFVCKTCIKKLVLKQTGQDLADICYISNPNHLFESPSLLEQSLMFKELHPIVLKERNSGIIYSESLIDGTGRKSMKVFKVRRLEENQKFLLVRFAQQFNPQAQALIISDESEIEVLCVLEARLTSSY